MTANINPIFGRTSDLQLAGAIIGTSANTATDGTGANISAIYQADATEGSYVYTVRLKSVASTAATVARLWYHSTTGAFTPGTTNTAANTTMIAEVTLAAFTASNTLASPTYEIPVNIAMPPGTRLLMSFGTTTGAATTGFNPLIIAMKY